MENYREFPLEVRLSAFIDGQLGDEETREIEELIASSEEARAILEQLKAGSDFGNQAFADMLNEPVPLHLVRTIKDASAKAAPVRQAANSNVVSFFRFMPQAIAASAVLLLAGGYSGYFIGANRSFDSMPSTISETSDFGVAPGATREVEVKTRGLTFDAPAPAIVTGSDDMLISAIAGIHGVYSREGSHMAEIPASDSEALKTWLAASTGVNFTIPDLSAEGYSFKGGRLLAVDGKPAGGLFYKDEVGKIVAFYFLKGTTAEAKKVDGINEVLAGTKGDTAWFVAAPAGMPTNGEIADKAAAAL